MIRFAGGHVAVVVLALAALHPFPIYVLTLADAAARQRRLAAWVRSCGLSPSFIEGVDLRSPTAQFQAPPGGRAQRWQRYGRADLSAPEYGCLLGHHRIWAQILAAGHPWALVLEDDATPVVPEWLEQLEELVGCLQGSSLWRSPWVVHLSLVPGEFGEICLKPVAWRHGMHGVLAVGQVDPSIRKVWTTLAYLISREAAARLLAVERNLPWMADDWTMRQRSGALPYLLAAWKPVFGGYNDFPTQIEQRVGFPPKPLWYKIWFRLVWPFKAFKRLAYNKGWFAVRY